jgi:hypothetical protein
MSVGRRGLVAAMALAAIACGVPDVTFYDDVPDSSSDAACPTGGLYSGICCQSLPKPIPCIGAACSATLCAAGKCDQCIGEVCCAKANGTTLCRADVPCPP